MALCAVCGEENPAKARFCLACGRPFAAHVLVAKTSEVRKVVTVVFCDLARSTELGERLDVEALRALLDVYFSTMSDVLRRHGGTVEKFIGDAVVAVFGVPALHEDDALRAVRASMQMAAAMTDLSSEFERTWGVTSGVRIGVNTGEVIAGDSAGRERLATGDAVNVAARLEQMALPGQVVIGPDTYRLVRAAVRVDALPSTPLKGKTEPIDAFRVLEVIADTEGYARRSDAPLVGRDDDLVILQRCYQEAVSAGACRRALVVGMAGIGKSRLLAEFLGGLGGATVLAGSCLPYGRGITFWPVREMLRTAAGWTTEDSAEDAVDRLAHLLPGEADGHLIASSVAALVGLTDAPGRMEEGFWAVRRMLESLSRWHPVVVVADDLHWAEASMLELLNHLNRTDGPVLVVGAARPELFDDHPMWGHDMTQVHLNPLGDEPCDRLIDAVLGSDGLPDAVRHHVHAAAEGNPLFVEQVLATFREDGILVESTSGWAATRRLTAQMVPPSIQALLRARLERLTPAEQADLEAAAVVGRVFWRSAVAELAQATAGGQPGAQLPGLIGRELIDPDGSDFVHEDAYRFHHILVRDAAYSGLPKAARAEAHERFADWLRGAAGERVNEYDEILGYHLEQAFDLRSGLAPVGQRERALARAAGGHLAVAGNRSFARGDISGAVSLLRRAHRLLDVDPRRRLQLVPTLAEAMSWRGDLPGATALLEAAAVESAEIGDRALTMRIDLAKASLRATEDSTELEERISAAAVEVFAEEGDDEGLARAWMMVGLTRLGAGHTADAESAWARAITPARRAAPELAEEVEMWLASYGIYGPTPFEEAAARLDRMGATVGGKPYREGTLLRGRAHVAAARGEFATAYRLLRRSRETYSDLGLRFPAALVSHTAYEVALREGTLVHIIPELEGDEKTLEEMAERWSRSTTAAMLAHALHRAGRLDHAVRMADVARRLTRPGDVFSQVLWRTARAKILSSEGEGEGALRLADEAVALAGPSDWPCMRADALLDQAEVLAMTRRTEDALHQVDRARRLYQQKQDTASVARADKIETSLRTTAP